MSEKPHPPLADMSIEDIRSSIRRLLNEGDAPPASPVAKPGVLILDESMMVPDEKPTLEPAAPLLAPEAAAAATSLGVLVQKLGAERGLATHRDGPTIEEIVREEIRLLLKAWLDQNLPTLVERVVLAELERLLASSG